MGWFLLFFKRKEQGQRGSITCPKSPSWEVVDLGFRPQLSDCSFLLAALYLGCMIKNANAWAPPLISGIRFLKAPQVSPVPAAHASLLPCSLVSYRTSLLWMRLMSLPLQWELEWMKMATLCLSSWVCFVCGVTVQPSEFPPGMSCCVRVFQDGRRRAVW